MKLQGLFVLSCWVFGIALVGLPLQCLCSFLLEWKCLFHTNVYLKHVTWCLLLEGLMVKRVHESRKVLWTFEQCWNFETTGTSEVRMDAFYITRWPGIYCRIG